MIKIYAVEACFDTWNEDQLAYPINWDHIGTVYFEGEMPRFITINGMQYERKD